MKDFAKSIVCNSKVGNGIKEDMKRSYPKDSIVDDVKSSATYEAIIKQPWKVYDILGVGDSVIREYAFELISRKYGIDYDTIYYAWLHNGYKLSDYKSPSAEERAKKDFQKLGVQFSNSKTGNKKVGNANTLVYQKDYGNGIKVSITKNQEMENYYFWSLFDGPSRVAFGDADSLSQAQSQSHAVAERRRKWLKKINGNSKVVNFNWGRARDAQGIIEEYMDYKKEGNENMSQVYKNKIKERLQDVENRKKDLLEDLKDTEEAIKIYRKAL